MERTRGLCPFICIDESVDIEKYVKIKYNISPIVYSKYPNERRN